MPPKHKKNEEEDYKKGVKKGKFVYFEIEAIWDKKRMNGSWRWLTSWTDHPDKSWEPKSNLLVSEPAKKIFEEYNNMIERNLPRPPWILDYEQRKARGEDVVNHTPWRPYGPKPADGASSLAQPGDAEQDDERAKHQPEDANIPAPHPRNADEEPEAIQPEGSPPHEPNDQDGLAAPSVGAEMEIKEEADEPEEDGPPVAPGPPLAAVPSYGAPAPPPINNEVAANRAARCRKAAEWLLQLQDDPYSDADESIEMDIFESSPSSSPSPPPIAMHTSAALLDSRGVLLPFVGSFDSFLSLHRTEIM